jgi:hypothetical protein
VRVSCDHAAIHGGPRRRDSFGSGRYALGLPVDCVHECIVDRACTPFGQRITHALRHGLRQFRCRPHWVTDNRRAIDDVESIAATCSAAAYTDAVAYTDAGACTDAAGAYTDAGACTDAVAGAYTDAATADAQSTSRADTATGAAGDRERKGRVANGQVSNSAVRGEENDGVHDGGHHVQQRIV